MEQWFRFVSSLHILPSSPSTLISGGGDPSLKVWDWLSGKLLGDIPIEEAVEPFIVVKRIIGRNRWSENDEGGDDEDETVSKKKGKGKKARKGKGKQAQALGEDGEQGDEKPGDAMDVDPKGEDAKAQPRKILAVRRIESVTVEATTRVVFSTTGCVSLRFRFKSLPAMYTCLLPYGSPHCLRALLLWD